MLRILRSLSPPSPIFSPIYRTFAGHNKWSKIKRKKGANDAARSAMITKVSKEITQAASASGGDLESLRLQTAVAKGRSLNVPRDTINGAIDRGINGKDVVNASVVRYDGTVKCGTATVCVVLMGLTDNKNRTSATVKAAFRKFGELLPTNKNAFAFREVSCVRVVLGGEDEETQERVMEAALEGGAEDVEFEIRGVEDGGGEEEEEEDRWMVATCYAPKTSLTDVVKSLRANPILEGCNVEPSMCLVPEVEVDVGEGTELGDFLEVMEVNEDITEVYHNAEG